MTRALAAGLLLVLAGCKNGLPWKKAPVDAGVAADAGAVDAGSDAAAPTGLYTSKPGGFRVRFPDGKSPDVEEKPIGGTGGATHLFKVQYGSGAYLVSYDDFSKEAREPRTASDILDGAKNGIVEGTGGTIESERPITLGGKHPGIELTLSATTSGIKMRQRLRAYAVDGRLYQTLVVTPDWTTATAVETEFLDSFSLL